MSMDIKASLVLGIVILHLLCINNKHKPHVLNSSLLTKGLQVILFRLHVNRNN